MRWGLILLAALAVLALMAGVSETAYAQTPVVNAVLFYSPTCPHCHTVMEEDLPPLQAQHGDQLRILEVNVQFPDGQKLYGEYVQKFAVPQERLGIPALVVGDRYYVGSFEIPEFFPAVVAQGLAGSGIDWPALPSMADYLEDHGLEGSQKPSAGELFAQDPVGNSISVVVLVAMVVSVILTGYALNSGGVNLRRWPRAVVPVLVLIGAGVAVYLSYIEITHTEALCGPVGDCNAVQTSRFAYLFGVIPIAVLGLLGFLAIGTTWAAGNFTRLIESQPKLPLVLWGLALGGTVFSIYLTFLEPFVIGATCAWCLTSSVVMTLLLWATTPEAVEAHHSPSGRRGRKGYRKFKTRRAR